ncbi:MAG: bacterial Ig-like domain-containing protein [Clostridia bacterium]|nr:bacterial Ig-like domain-containing protein [Clostridia bacterium]
MNEIKIDKRILNEILDENTLKNEIAELVNELIDEELLKDDPDCDLIDECIDILDNLVNDDYSNVIPFINKTYKGRFSKKVWSILVACAVILAATVGTVAVGYTVEKIREQKEAEKTTTATVTTTATTTTTTQSTTAVFPAKLILSFVSGFKDEYVVGEKFDPNGIVVKIEMSDGNVRVVSADEFEITTDKNFGKEEKYETVTVKYEDLTETFKVRVLRDEDTKVLNSVYAAFPDDFDFRADDINNIDLAGMEVYAVYSDKTEEKLSEGDYTVETEILPDGKTAMITVRHKSVYAQFGIRERS